MAIESQNNADTTDFLLMVHNIISKYIIPQNQFQRDHENIQMTQNFFLTTKTSTR